MSSAVGVAKSSILWHFGSKDALLTEAVFDLFEEIDEKITLEKSNLQSLQERVDYLLDSVATYLTNNPQAKGIVITLLLNGGVPAEIHGRIREQWARHTDEIREFLSTDSDPVSEVFAASLMALMHGCYLQWHLNGCREDLREKLAGAYATLGTVQNPVDESEPA